MLEMHDEAKTYTQFTVYASKVSTSGRHYAGRDDSHELAGDTATPIGTPIAGRKEFPLLCNIAPGSVVTLVGPDGPYERDLGGLTAVVPVSKDDLQKLNAMPERRLALSFKGIVSSINLEAGTLEGSVWLESDGKFSVSRPGLGLLSPEDFDRAANRARSASLGKLEAARAARAALGRGSQVKA